MAEVYNPLYFSLIKSLYDNNEVDNQFVARVTETGHMFQISAQGFQEIIGISWADWQAQHDTTTQAPTTEASTTKAAATKATTTKATTTKAATTKVPTTKVPTTKVPTTKVPTTKVPTTKVPTTKVPTTKAATTEAPTTKPKTSDKTITKVTSKVPNSDNVIQ